MKTLAIASYIRGSFVGLLVVTVMLACTPSVWAVMPEYKDEESITGSAVQAPHPQRNEEDFVPNEVLVTFKPGVYHRAEQANAVSKAPGFKRIKKHFADKNFKPHRLGGGKGLAIFERLVLIELEEGTNLGQTIKALKKDPRIKTASPNYYVYAQETFTNDTHFSLLWGLHNTGQTDGTPDADIDAPEAWDIGTGSHQIIVAVIDTGVEYDHPDLTENMWSNPNEIPGNGIDDDSNGFVDDIYGYDFYNDDADPRDDHFHGTHCSGTVGAKGNNDLGVVGVNWSVRVMALKFMGAQGSGWTSGAIESVEYAVNNGARVMSNSWGSSSPTSALQDAITAAREAGVLFVAAAGNSNSDLPHYPSAFEDVMSVAATDDDDQKASFSNWGPTIDLAAPGVSIASTNLDAGYRYASGTSMATPHVAGLAGLLLSRNPALTPDELEFIMKSSVDDLGELGWDPYFGEGRINAHQAMQLVTPGQALPIVTISSPLSGESIFGVVDIVGSATGTDFASYTLEYAASEDIEWTTFATSTTPVENGLLATLSSTESFPEGSISLRLTLTVTQGQEYSTTVVPEVNNIVAELEFEFPVTPASNPIDIFGTAAVNLGDFDHFTLEYGAGNSPTNWSSDRFALVGGGMNPVNDGLLAAFNIEGLEGRYTVRLTVFSSLHTEVISRSIYVDFYIKDGWPVILDRYSWRPGVVGDINGDGNAEIMMPTYLNHQQGDIFVYDKDGEHLFTYNDNPGYDSAIVNTHIGLAELAEHPGLEFAFFEQHSQDLMAANQTSLLEGFPADMQPGNFYSWVTSVCTMIYDVDGNGELDIITPTTYGSPYPWNEIEVRLNVVDKNGNSLPGFPFAYPYIETGFARSGAVADLDNDGYAEIFFTAWIKDSSYNIVEMKLFGVDHQGNLLPGFPKTYTGFPVDVWFMYLGDIVVADINGDGEKEILFNETGSMYLPPQIFRFATHALNKNGEELSGWPYVVEGELKEIGQGAFSGGLIAIGDVTGDAAPEVVVSYARGNGLAWRQHQDLPLEGFDITILNGDGTVLHRIPNSAAIADSNVAGYFFTSSLTLAELTGDGKAEILATRKRVEFNQHFDKAVQSVVIHSNFEPIFELLPQPVPEGNTVVYPGHFYSFTLNCVDIADIDQDGLAELYVGYNGAVGDPQSAYTRLINYVWDLPYSYSEEQMEWPTFQGNLARTGEYIYGSDSPNPPDEIPPSVNITSPADGSTVSGTIEISATAVDNIGVALVDFLVDGVLIATDTTAPYAVTFDTTTVPNGSISIAAIAYDTSDNSAQDSILVTVDNADTQPPSINITSPAEGSTVSGTITITASASDNIGVVRVEFYVDGNLLGADQLAPYEWLLDTTTLSEGEHILLAIAYDAAENSGQSQPVSINVDNIPPNVPPVVEAGDNQEITLPDIAYLNGTVTDDGLPNPPAEVTVEWSKLSGPGIVTFADASAVDTTASFSEAGSYTLQLTASDSQYTSNDTVTITVNPESQQNTPPIVDAGEDQEITLPDVAYLDGTVSDDGLPNPPGETTVEWSKLSGPGIVTFADASALDTTASFSEAGSYTLELTASDSEYTSNDTVTITVNPESQQNTAPIVDAGEDQEITLPDVAYLDGTVTDDGLPNPPGETTVEWSKLSGKGRVTFVNPNATDTIVSFKKAGTYVFELTASDSQLSASDTVTIIVNRKPKGKKPH